jgi:hypothetical protein
VSKEWKFAGSRPEKFRVQKVGRKNPHLIVVLRKFSEIGFKIADQVIIQYFLLIWSFGLLPILKTKKKKV